VKECVSISLQPQEVEVKVTYEKSLLRVTKQFENKRITVGMEDEARSGESAEEAYNRVRRFVDGKIADEIVEETLGVEEARFEEKTARRRRVRETAAKQFNLRLEENF
jgi:hypothetical protein